MSTAESPVLNDNSALEQLAAEPDRRLFPLLGRADAMLPLVVVLSFLPALYALANRTLTEPGAWQGLLSLECLAARDLSEFVDPAGSDPAQPLRFQAPLMNWLTAFSMWLFGVGQTAGLVAPAYFCTAGLVVAAYVFARRLGGEQLGLMSAVLLAFNPRILQGAQEPLPQSAAVLFATLALAGMIAHWQKSSAVASYRLLLAGIALGMCLLAGGIVAPVIVLVVFFHVLLWKAVVWRRSGLRLVWDRSRLSRRTALRSAAVFAATGFAVGGWHLMFMGTRYGAEFWRGWAAAGTEPSPLSEQPLVRASLAEVALDLSRLALPLSGLALVGLFGIVRDLRHDDEDPGKRHRGLLVIWVGIALCAWIICPGARRPGSPTVQVWETLLAVSLVISAAAGFLEIAERRIGYLASAAAMILPLANAALLFDRASAEPARTGRWFTLWGAQFSLGGALALAILAVGAVAVVRLIAARAARRAALMTTLLLATVFANCLWGALAVRRTSGADRQLAEIRAGLAPLKSVESCTFVSLSAPEEQQRLHPPAQLAFVVRSLWPAAEMSYAGSWEEASPTRRANSEPNGNGVSVLIAWFPRGRNRPAAPAGALTTLAPAFLYRSFEVVAYSFREQSPKPGP